MKILIGFQEGEISVGGFYKRAFESLGHETIVVGPGHDSKYSSSGVYGPGNGIYIYDAKDIYEKENYDLALLIEPGLFFSNVANIPVPCAIYCVDSMLFPSTWQMEPFGGIEYLKEIKGIFTARMAHVPLWERFGLVANYLPLAYDPEYHYSVEAEKKYDIVFVGRAMPEIYPERAHVLKVLRDAGFSVWTGQVMTDDYCQRVAEGKIALNNSHEPDTNMRFFELLGMKSLQLTTLMHGQEILGFYPRKHIYCYNTDTDLINKCNEILGKDKVRAQVAEAGYQQAKTHTYQDRAKEMLNIVFKR